MSTIERKLAALGLQLPAPLQVPPGIELPFRFVRVVDARAFISGHGPQNPDGSLAAWFDVVADGADKPAPKKR